MFTDIIIIIITRSDTRDARNYIHGHKITGFQMKSLKVLL